MKSVLEFSWEADFHKSTEPSGIHRLPKETLKSSLKLQRSGPGLIPGEL